MDYRWCLRRKKVNKLVTGRNYTNLCNRRTYEKTTSHFMHVY